MGLDSIRSFSILSNMVSSSNDQGEEVLKWKFGETIWQQSLSLSNRDVVTAINDGKFQLMCGKMGEPVEIALNDLMSMATNGTRGVKKETSVALHILMVDGPRDSCKTVERALTKTTKGCKVYIIPDSTEALEHMNKLAADERKMIKLLLIDIGRLGGRTAYLDTIKEIIPEVPMVVTVPSEGRDLAFTEEVINAGAIMVVMKPFHKMFAPFVSALL